MIGFLQYHNADPQILIWLGLFVVVAGIDG